MATIRMFRRNEKSVLVSITMAVRPAKMISVTIPACWMVSMPPGLELTQNRSGVKKIA